MTNKEIIRLARQAGFHITDEDELRLCPGDPMTIDAARNFTIADGIKRVVLLAVEAECEECAKVCDEMWH